VIFTTERGAVVARAALVSTSNAEIFLRNQSLWLLVIRTSALRYQTAAAVGQSATKATVAGAEAEAISGTPQSRRTPPFTLSPLAGVADEAMDSKVSGVTTTALGSVSAFLSAVMPLRALRACVSAPRATLPGVRVHVGE
jgi:hypothetical protein